MIIKCLGWVCLFLFYIHIRLCVSLAEVSVLRMMSVNEVGGVIPWKIRNKKKKKEILTVQEKNVICAQST